MACRWLETGYAVCPLPSASRPARDARTPCAPACGSPAVSAPQVRYPRRASPPAPRGCCRCALHRAPPQEPGEAEDKGDDDKALGDDGAERGRVERMKKRRARARPAPTDRTAPH
eukprot:6185115-Prymnesium_polylepis.1